MQGISVHGDRPWEIAHIDHTLADIELVYEETGLVLGRPWPSLLLDGFSRRILAFVLLFDRPTYRTCLLLLTTSRSVVAVIVNGTLQFVTR